MVTLQACLAEEFLLDLVDIEEAVQVCVDVPYDVQGAAGLQAALGAREADKLEDVVEDVDVLGDVLVVEEGQLGVVESVVVVVEVVGAVNWLNLQWGWVATCSKANQLTNTLLNILTQQNYQCWYQKWYR